jgi:iron(III) transport system ATP-binding protein
LDEPAAEAVTRPPTFPRPVLPLKTPYPADTDSAMIPVRIERLAKSFGSAKAVDAAELSIAGGELFFLLGPSGCGKTTLLRMIAGFLEPDAGRIRFGDQDITRLPPHRRRTGMVFQNYALWPHMTVAGNVAFGLEMLSVAAAEKDRRVAEALALVGMADKAGRRPNELSGGQQQRVALARALVIEPACVLLDEPLSNLDAKLRNQMRVEIRRICKDKGLTGIHVTHDQKEALSMADRIAVMNRGRIEQVGPPREVYRRPRSAFVADFLGETNFLHGECVGAAGEGAVRVRTAFGEVTAVDPFGKAAAGRRATVSVRPEAVRLGAAEGEGVNVFAGTLARSVYLGETAEHSVSLSGGEMRVFQLNPPEAASGPVRIGFSPEDAVVVESA